MDSTSPSNLTDIEWALFVGAHVTTGIYAKTITHYDVLRTLEALERVPFTNEAANASTIADIWQA